MVEKEREKLTIAFNEYEARQLNSIQISYLFGKPWYSMVPSVNDILKGMVVYTYLETRQKRVLKSFLNGFLKRRRYPPAQTESQENYADTTPIRRKVEELVKEVKEEVRYELAQKFINPKLGNYSFYFEAKELKVLTELKSEVSGHSGIPSEKISNPEIVKECIHFVVENDVRNTDFRFLTYGGFLYQLPPIISVIVGHATLRGGVNEDDIKLLMHFLGQAPATEFAAFFGLGEDAKVLESFKKAYLEHWKLNRWEDVSKISKKYMSKAGNFDFYNAFIGSMLMFYGSTPDVKDIADSITSLTINQKKSTIEALLNIFYDYLNAFYPLSIYIGQELSVGEDFDPKKWVKLHEAEKLE